MEQQQSFETLKNMLTSSPVLIFPDYSKELMVSTDFSDILLNVILMQESNEKPKPKACASRLCSTTENNYSITEREILVVIYCTDKFRHIFIGCAIRVSTDHTAFQLYFLKHKSFEGYVDHYIVELWSKTWIYPKQEKHSSRYIITKYYFTGWPKYEDWFNYSKYNM